MRGRKRFTATLLALAFVLTTLLGSLSVSASEASKPIVDPATAKGELTIVKKDAKGDSVNGAGFSLYKIMDLKPKTGGGYEYTKVAAYASVLGSVTPDTLGNYSSVQIEALADNIMTAIAAGPIAATKVTPDTTSGQTKATDLDLGYYMVVETKVPAGYTAAAPFFVAIPSTNNYKNNTTAGQSWDYQVVVEAKNVLIDVTKKITNARGDHEKGTDSNAEPFKNSDTVAVGDTVEYRISASVPAYTSEYFTSGAVPTFKLTDVLSDGLQIMNGAAPWKEPVVNVVRNGTTTQLTKNTHYTLDTINATGPNPDLTVTFTKTFLEDSVNHGHNVTVDYAAKVTSAAVLGKPGNPNTVNLTYTSKPGVDAQGKPFDITTPDIIKYVYTFQLEVVKVNEKDERLEGAAFKLYKADALGNITKDASGNITNAEVGSGGETNGTGMLSLTHLDAGVYYLVETKSPAGYTLLTNPIKIKIDAPKVLGDTDGTIEYWLDDKKITDTAQDLANLRPYVNSDDGKVSVTAINRPGFKLPGTGGMGIAVFLAVAFVGITMISVMLVKAKKVRV